ncbi:rhodanese-like domain-containing protein [Fluviispira multicolorata]|uniref:Rhodanese domain-containing protein n=1 Tax=Fluviispira multicolorata TaxID=2654512 RepID=A0A833N5A4_9BACT|nr:rhodanese-like domain-containing protein [Fluviispira multicolorata]KAB8029972.1 hypothetical protein GCL57_10575 [Fluviispira multicolorata]
MKINCTEFAQMYKNADKNKRVLLDIRNDDEVQKGSLPGCLHIPLPDLEFRYLEIPSESEVFIYCKAGGRAEKAEMFLTHKGLKKTRYANPGGYEELKDLF